MARSSNEHCEHYEHCPEDCHSALRFRKGRWMPNARRCQYRTAHRRRAGAVAAGRWKHGFCSAQALAEQKRVREPLSQSRELLKQMQAG
jgi:hypothetical protein